MATEKGFVQEVITSNHDRRISYRIISLVHSYYILNFTTQEYFASFIKNFTLILSSKGH